MRKPDLSALIVRQEVVVGVAAVAVVLRVNYAKRWLLVMKNESGVGVNITAVSIRRYPVIGSDPTAYTALATGLPVAPGDKWGLEPASDDSCEAIELSITASAPGVAYLTLGGL